MPRKVLVPDELVAADLLIWTYLQLFILVWKKGPQYDEIAAVTNLSTDAVLHRLRRLKAAGVLRWEIDDPEGMRILVPLKAGGADEAR